MLAFVVAVVVVVVRQSEKWLGAARFWRRIGTASEGEGTSLVAAATAAVGALIVVAGRALGRELMASSSNQAPGVQVAAAVLTGAKRVRDHHTHLCRGLA